MKLATFCLSILITFSTNINAETKSTFIESATNFHKLDVDIYKKDKNNIECIHCHLLDDISNSDAKWFQPKNSIDGTIENFDDVNGNPDSFSKACLLCHDGSEASLVINAPISPCGIKSTVSVGQNGENHPVFIEYTNKQDLHDFSSSLNGAWNGATQVSDLLREKKVVCISCHLPHHSKRRGYLRTSMNGSRLCIGCHKK